MRALKKKGKKTAGAEKTGEGGKGREENENKNLVKKRDCRGSKNSARIMEYTASRAYLNGGCREGEKTVSGLRMIEIDGRTIDPGQQILSAGAQNCARGNAADAHGTKNRYRSPRSSREHEFNGWNLI